MTETTIGREPIQIVELRQPLCANTYGSAPCTASGTGDEKCYNTRRSCQDPENYALGTPLSLFFSRGGVAEQRVSGATLIRPWLRSVSTAPARVNLGASKCRHCHTELHVDPALQSVQAKDVHTDQASAWIGIGLVVLVIAVIAFSAR